jgi:hypothetical protein
MGMYGCDVGRTGGFDNARMVDPGLWAGRLGGRETGGLGEEARLVCRGNGKKASACEERQPLPAKKNGGFNWRRKNASGG